MGVERRMSLATAEGADDELQPITSTQTFAIDYLVAKTTLNKYLWRETMAKIQMQRLPATNPSALKRNIENVYEHRYLFYQINGIPSLSSELLGSIQECQNKNAK